jgi:predicted DsbA family dithiol-disulfide isomerase
LAHIETKRKALFIKGFFDAERLIRIAKAQNPNLSDQEAEKLFEKLVDEGQIAMDQEGWWRWTT